MRLLYWTSLIVMLMLIGLNMVAAPILQHITKYTVPIHKTLYIDRNLSEEELFTITAAAMEWHLATNSLITYDVVRLPHKNIDIENSIVIVIVSADFPEIIALDSAEQQEEGTHMGYYHERGYVPYIGLVPGRIEDREYKAVILHELGHSLGMKHTDDVSGIGTLMYPNIDGGANKITDEDLQAFCQIYGCNASKLHDR